ncbi:hypothetical protein [Nocardioides sp.]|uniref:hypothetical protein n=1 Tax=Nocardioides sp. TaxID=35761 RepID=UPI002735EB2F|nr:hypothetical protein [Nocardioides sp.]MDP3893748.1 hypothetical protein [Nocardioides sp.]
MTDQLDSRTLHNTDCYGQRFMRAGTYRYAVGPAGAPGWTREFPYIVEVVDQPDGKDKAMAQRTVMVRRDGREFLPDAERITIDVGDMVTWHSPDARTRPFAVTGEKAFFGSHRLVNESGYTHIFTSADIYEWADAHGSQLHGTVRVTDPQCRTAEDVRAWQERLGEGTLVMISDGRAEPREVEVLIGQTVLFAVVDGPGVSITDTRLLEPGRKAPGREAHSTA